MEGYLFCTVVITVNPKHDTFTIIILSSAVRSSIFLPEYLGQMRISLE